jgi:hypothetical protein
MLACGAGTSPGITHACWLSRFVVFCRLIELASA